MLLAETTKAQSPEVKTCIEKCNAALLKQDLHIKNIEGINSLQSTLLNKQNEKIAKLESEATAWNRNPVLLLAIGFSLGIAYNMSNNNK